MRQQRLDTLLRWLHREHRMTGISIVWPISARNVFFLAHTFHHGEVTKKSQDKIARDVSAYYDYGRVPRYVATFIERVLFPSRLTLNTRKIPTTSEKRPPGTLLRVA